MNYFPTAKEAKEYLVGQIADEAQRERVPLSEIERKMLYFSETYWTLPDMVQVNEEFGREYDADEFEKKIARLIAAAYRRAKGEDSPSLRTWRDAIATLGREDHYITVMAQQAGVTGRWYSPVPAANQASPLLSSKTRVQWWAAAVAIVFLSALLAASFYFGGYSSRGVRAQWVHELHQNVPVSTFIGYIWAAVIVVGVAVLWANPAYRLANRCFAGLRRAFLGRRD